MHGDCYVEVKYFYIKVYKILMFVLWFVFFQIYADSQGIIDDVCHAIDQVCKDEVKEIVMDKPADQETIKNLTADQVSCIIYEYTGVFVSCT